MKYSYFDKYKDILGKPNTGLHKYKLLDTAVVDYVLTIVVAIVFSYYTKVPLVLSTILWFVIGIISHMLFGVETTVVKYFK